MSVVGAVHRYTCALCVSAQAITLNNAAPISSCLLSNPQGRENPAAYGASIIQASVTGLLGCAVTLPHSKVQGTPSGGAHAQGEAWPPPRSLERERRIPTLNGEANLARLLSPDGGRTDGFYALPRTRTEWRSTSSRGTTAVVVLSGMSDELSSGPETDTGHRMARGK